MILRVSHVYVMCDQLEMTPPTPLTLTLTLKYNMVVQVDKHKTPYRDSADPRTKAQWIVTLFADSRDESPNPHASLNADDLKNHRC